jgi:hypothetical protein
MNARPTILVLSALLCGVSHAADVLEGDFATITIGTNTFTNAHLRAYSPVYGSLRHNGGVEKVRLADLPEPARSKFHDPERVKAVEAKVASVPKKEMITEEDASRINAFAEKFDMTVEEVMRWDYVLPRRGLSLADFDQALTNLEKAREKALGYRPEIPRRNNNGRRLRAGDPKPGQSSELSTKEEDAAKMLKAAGYGVPEKSPGQLVPSKDKAPNAGIRVGKLTLTIKNEDKADWPSINVYINSDPPFGFGLRLPPLKAGAELKLQLNEFCKPDGLRFDPFSYAVTKVCVGGNGFGYQAYRFE